VFAYDTPRLQEHVFTQARYNVFVFYSPSKTIERASKVKEMNWDLIRQRLRELIDQHGYESDTEFATDFGVTKGTLWNWLNGREIPLNQLEGLARHFNVSLLYMLGLDHPDSDDVLRLKVAYYEGLFRGLIYRKPFIATGFREELTQMYWGSLINESRGLLDAVDSMWEGSDKAIKPLLAALQTNPSFKRDYVRIVIQICHYLSNRMKFQERIQLSQSAQATAIDLIKLEVGKIEQRNWLAAALILKIDGEGWARIELGDTDKLDEELEEAEQTALKNNLPYLAALATIFRARAILHRGIEKVHTFHEREVCLKSNAADALAILRSMPKPDWSEFITANRYHAVHAEIALADGRFQEAIDDHLTIIQYETRGIEFGVGTHCSLGYAYVVKALSSTGERRAQAIADARTALRKPLDDKLWSEDLLSRIANIRLLELEGRSAEALEEARKARFVFIAQRDIHRHNLISVLRFLLEELDTKP
jgi:transcriptional regulator with XRE-family HTH domain